MKKHFDGIFISFEGIEGSGKTTQAEMLADFLRNKTKKNIFLTREPGGTQNAEAIRNLLINGEAERWLPISELLLFFAARYELWHRLISPFLSDGGIVICDRFIDSTFAYQGAKDIDSSLIKRLVEILKISPKKKENQIIKDVTPDITFLIDISLKTSEERVINRGSEIDRFETLKKEFHNKVRNAYLKIQKEEKRIKIINGEKGKEEIHNEVVKAFEENFAY